MVREDTTERTTRLPLIVGRFLDQYPDADIEFKDNLPPHLLETSVATEVGTVLGSQLRTGSMVNFLRSPVASSPPKGGYALFSTDRIKISGNNDAIIGNVHTNRAMEFCGVNTHVAGDVGAGDVLFCNVISLSFVTGLTFHNDPIPPTGDTPSHAVLPMDGSATTATTLFNYDVDRDNFPGLLLVQPGSGIPLTNETDPSKFQVWRTGILQGDLTVPAGVIVNFYTNMRDTGLKVGAVTAFLRDLDPVSSSYTEISNGTVLVEDWQGGSTGFVSHAIFITNPVYEIPSGHELEVRVLVNPVSDQKIWFAYDTVAFPSWISSSNHPPDDDEQLVTIYLHNDPTPPTGDTVSHTVLPMDFTAPTATTLFNYDSERDAAPGLLINKTPQFNVLPETDPSKVQVWRTAPLTTPLTFTGGLFMDIFAAPKNFDQNKKAGVVAYIRDYDPAATTYTEIGNGGIWANDWQEGSTTFVKRPLFIPDVNYTVPVGHQLEVKIGVNAKSDADMVFAYDTTSFPTRIVEIFDFRFPQPPQFQSGPTFATVEFMHEGVATGALPVTFSTGDFQTFTFSFVGDVDLNSKNEVWLDGPHTQLKPGVYYTTGNFTLSNNDVSGQVTLIARDILISGASSRLTPFKDGVLLFATGNSPTGIAVEITGGDATWTGIVYAPAEKVKITAFRFFLDGSVFTDGFDWGGLNGRDGLISFNSDLFQE